MIIDDEEVVRDLVTQVLATEEYEVVAAEDGARGLSLYHEEPFDLVITDILMPVKDGLQVIRELRRDFPSARIVATAAMGGQALKDAEDAGADRTLAKPFRIDGLLQIVRPPRKVGFR